MADEKIEGLRFAVATLERYHRKHQMTTKDVILSQWARGVFSGRGESINILNEEIKKLEARTNG